MGKSQQQPNDQQATFNVSTDEKKSPKRRHICNLIKDAAMIALSQTGIRVYGEKQAQDEPKPITFGLCLAPEMFTLLRNEVLADHGPVDMSHITRLTINVNTYVAVIVSRTDMNAYTDESYSKCTDAVIVTKVINNEFMQAVTTELMHGFESISSLREMVYKVSCDNEVLTKKIEQHEAQEQRLGKIIQIRDSELNNEKQYHKEVIRILNAKLRAAGKTKRKKKK